MRYDYWVVRYVPDAIRGEFVNVGVIAGRGQDWAMRKVSHLGRASRLGGSATATSQFLARVEASISQQIGDVEALVVTQREPLGKGVIEDLRARMNNVVQLSPPRPVLAESAEDAADMAFELMVVDLDHTVRHRSRTLVVHELREAFGLRPELLRHVARAQNAAIGQQKTRVDFAVKNGSVRQLSQVWAFDVRDTRSLETHVQAWNFIMSLLRDEGGQLEQRTKALRAAPARIPTDVTINAVYTEPTTTEGARQLKLALDGWRRIQVHPIESGDSTTVVEEAERLISA